MPLEMVSYSPCVDAADMAYIVPLIMPPPPLSEGDEEKDLVPPPPRGEADDDSDICLRCREADCLFKLYFLQKMEENTSKTSFLSSFRPESKVRSNMALEDA